MKRKIEKFGRENIPLPPKLHTVFHLNSVLMCPFEDHMFQFFSARVCEIFLTQCFSLTVKYIFIWSGSMQFDVSWWHTWLIDWIHFQHRCYSDSSNKVKNFDISWKTYQSATLIFKHLHKRKTNNLPSSVNICYCQSQHELMKFLYGIL